MQRTNCMLAMVAFFATLTAVFSAACGSSTADAPSENSSYPSQTSSFATSDLTLDGEAEESDEPEEERTPSEGLAYRLNDEGTAYAVIGIGEYTKTDVVIPSVYQDLPVTRIESAAFAENTTLTSVFIPESITSIDYYAFKGCKKLTEIIYNATACEDLSYKSDVFGDAGINGKGITVTIGKNVTKVPANLFYVYSVSDTFQPPKIVNVVFKKRSACESIGGSAFQKCKNLTKISIPNSVTSIGNNAFEDCSSLTSITIPNSVTSIGYRTFSGCSSLTSITIPNSVTSIGYFTFSGCSSLTSISLSENITSIEPATFSDCSSLTSITIPKNITRIENLTFSGCSSLTDIVIPDGVTTIRNSAFQNCTELTNLTIPNSVTSIGEKAFYNCNGLMTISFNGSVNEWNAIEKGTDWNKKAGYYELVCTDGKLDKKGNTVK